MNDRDINKRLREMHEYSKEQLKNADKKTRLIHRLTLSIFLFEFLLIAIGILLMGLKQNYIMLGVSVGIFLLTVIIGANISAIKRAFIKIAIRMSKEKVEVEADILDDEWVGGSTVNGELAKAVMKFTFQVDGRMLTGFKVLKVKRIRRKKDFKDNDAYKRRCQKFLNDVEENGRKLNIMYDANKKYCIILDRADYVFNYFMFDVLFAENDE